MTSEVIATAFREACLAELQALKPGNVHVYAEGHGMTIADFEASAEAAAPHIAARGASVGERILGAVAATHERTGQNTNLGIVLLCAPLAAAAEELSRGAPPSSLSQGERAELRDLGEAQGTGIPGEGLETNDSAQPLTRRFAPPSPYGRGEKQDLCARLTAVLAALTVEDAELAFRAIALANPGGLGVEANHDVRAPARITLLEAMRLASHRDRVAHQYVTGFADIFDLGLPCVIDGETSAASAERIYWRFLTSIPDSHIARKSGLPAADEVRMLAHRYDRRLTCFACTGDRRNVLLTFDSELKQRGLNPGTTADLTVCTLFANELQKLAPGASA